MSKVVNQYWLSDGSGTTRRERQSCEYGAYVPDTLAGRTFAFDGDVTADVADAEAAIIRLNATTRALADTEALARLLLRVEAVASSRIEGLEIGPRRLLHADAARQEGAPGRRDVTAEEVLGNIDAMAGALEAADAGGAVSVATILDIHRRLLSGTHLEEHGGCMRTEQNWIGGSAYNPCSATFVPPPAGDVPGLLEDLAAFCKGDALPAVAQAAIAHAQFETIHPFVDGNGRTGRALIHLVLRRRGLAPHTVPPISLVLATRSAEYIGGLMRFRYVGDVTSAEAHVGINAWLSTFAGACTRSVADANAFDGQIEQIEAEWRERLAPVRRNSALDLLLARLPGTPVLTVNTAARLLGRSFPAASAAVAAAESAGILRQVTLGRRNRAFEAPEIIDAFTGLERRLASPDGDTRISPPSRPAPARRT